LNTINVRDVSLNQIEPVVPEDMLDPFSVVCAGSSGYSDYMISFAQQEICEVTAILAGDPEYDCLFHQKLLSQLGV
jgi:hypothetical protein